MPNNKLKVFGIMMVVILFVTVGLKVYGLGSGSNNNLAEVKNDSGFPSVIKDMQLMKVMSGPEAISMISGLHGTDIKIKEGYILTYAGLDGQIMMWISESADEAEARQLFKIMDDKIAVADKNKDASQQEGGPPFSNRRTLTQNGIDVIAVEGMDMENYYYQIGTKVYWIAVSGSEPLKVLEEVIERF